ncbi:MAG: GNAT family N-acetyltransferase [Roseiflexaceae bacterium]
MAINLTLIEPSLAWQAAFLEMAAEFVVANDLRYQAAITDFFGYLKRLQLFAQGTALPPGIVRETTYWGLDGATIVGCIRLRHQLTPALEQIGGHIGYKVRPSRRRQGYGTQLLALTLEHARQHQLTSVLITCDTDNIGSARIIEKNGGRLLDQTMVEGRDKPISRYWIELSSE